MKYSKNENNNILIINNVNGSFIYLFNNKIIDIHPTPYIGQYGPTKNPLFTNFPFSINLPITSIAHPVNEYIKKSKNNILIS